MRIDAYGKVMVRVALPSELMERAEAVLDSPVSGISSRRELVETALRNYLDSAEPVISKLEKELLSIRRT